jgi:hypothetical protein
MRAASITRRSPTVFEAVNSMSGGYRSYVGLGRSYRDTSFEAAVASAAHAALVELFPSQAANFDTRLAEDLAAIPWWRARAKRNGVELGRRAAHAILALRADDGSQHAEPRMGEDYVPADAPGIWTQDPISLAPIALGAHWAEVAPFTLRSADQFRVPPPPALDSAAYAEAFAEVGPPRLYNQIAVHIATLRPTRFSRRWGRRPAISWARTSRLRSPPIPRATPASAARSSRCCGTSTAPTTSRSRSSPTS